jgi:hypothetical protein
MKTANNILARIKRQIDVIDGELTDNHFMSDIHKVNLDIQLRTLKDLEAWILKDGR